MIRSEVLKASQNAVFLWAPKSRTNSRRFDVAVQKIKVPAIVRV